MGFGDIVILGVVGGGLLKMRNNAAEERQKEKRRKETPCNFDEGITEKEFAQIAKAEVRKIKRLKNIYVRGPVVYGTVVAQSGISDWTFVIDFNDYGKVTGKYWILSENQDSNIPQRVAQNISDAIKDLYINIDDVYDGPHL